MNANRAVQMSARFWSAASPLALSAEWSANSPKVYGAAHPGALSPRSGHAASIDDARPRLEAVPGDPFLFADWKRVLFFHFVIPPEALRAHVPPPFELELYNGQACMSVVAVTMRNFQPCRSDPLAFPFRCIREQRFLNLWTYVRWNGEPGAFFLHGWLSRPLGSPLPSSLLALPYTFANSAYEHVPENGIIRGTVNTANHAFAYRAAIPGHEWQPAAPGSLAEFVMERYSGFFCRKGKGYVFEPGIPSGCNKP